MTRHQSWLRLLMGVLACSCASVDRTTAAEVRIRIVDDGTRVVYLGPGQTTPLPVAVNVGDTVVWVNQDNTVHTATSVSGNGDVIFDTGDVRGGRDSDPQSAAEIFANAGGPQGGSVRVPYFCDYHDTMEGLLVVNDAGARNRARRVKRGERVMSARSEATLRIRRDITTLSASELTEYRDAWRTAQATSSFVTVCGHHDCPDEWCHRDLITFLPWHREYLLRLEQSIGQPLHYWDWTSTSASTDGIPAAFADLTYVSTDGMTYPNPLYSFTFDCNFPQTTERNPRDPADLTSIAAGVQAAYGQATYADFNEWLDFPHGGLHVWVGRHMGNTLYAAYDPIFWAHHSNVDRQWASWQKGGGPDPVGGELTEPLYGFGLVVGDRLDPAALGYAYDRYDAMPSRSRESAPVQLASAEQAEARADAPRGVGKSFVIDNAERLAADTLNDRDLRLYVGGIPEHPARSYAVYVFVNQPDATPADAKAENPHYAGYFGVFGQGHGPERADKHEKAKPKAVLTLYNGEKLKVNGPIRQITLVVTGDGRAVIPAEQIPFEDVSIRQVRDGEAIRTATSAGGQEFTGVSDKESYDEAYRAAVDEAQKSFGGADRLIAVEVVSVEGERGGIAGIRRMKVTIRATAD